MSVDYTELRIKNNDGLSMTIGSSNDYAGSKIKVTWFCGDRYYFSPDDARQMMAHVTTLEAHPDVSMETTDSRGTKIFIRVAHGKLFADTKRVTSTGGSYFTSLPDLRRAVGRILRAVDPS